MTNINFNVNLKTVGGTSIVGTGDIPLINPLFSRDIDFWYLSPLKFTAPFNMKINSIDKSKNPTMTVNITVNGSAYTFGTAINYKDDIVITTSIIGYVKLNCEKL